MGRLALAHSLFPVAVREPALRVRIGGVGRDAVRSFEDIYGLTGTAAVAHSNSTSATVTT